jgi:nondiscriminating aspartyl-tRNA synthetase
MERTLVNQVPGLIGQEVHLEGWVHQLRRLGKLNFLLLRDRTGVVQIVVSNPKLLPEDLSRESVIEVWGKVKSEPQAPGGVEVGLKELKVVVKSIAPLPFEVNRSLKKLNLKLDQLLSHRPFSLRHPEISPIFRVQAELVNAFREFLRQRDFLEIHTPKIVVSGTEGGTALFPVKYFEKEAYLAQSPQFYKQMLVGAGFERVFEVGPVYRAEDHATARHLNEYLSLDLELGFINSHEDVMDLEAEFLRYLIPLLKARCQAEFALYKVELPESSSIPRVRFDDAKEILCKLGKDLGPADDLDPEAERMIGRYVQDEFKSDFIFITHYPRSGRPFYTMPDPDSPGLSRSFDLIFRGLEVTTGSQRIHEYQQLISSIEEFGMDPENFKFYLEIFQYGMPPHGGLAIGAERLTQQLLGLKNIREACLFPRDRFRLAP